MDKQGKPVSEEVTAFLETFREEALGEDPTETSRKISFDEYLSSPEFQRRQKIAKETADREAFKKKMAFRSAQEQNPIKGRPRKKRGRKARQ